MFEVGFVQVRPTYAHRVGELEDVNVNVFELGKLEDER